MWDWPWVFNDALLIVVSFTNTSGNEGMSWPWPKFIWVRSRFLAGKVPNSCPGHIFLMVEKNRARYTKNSKHLMTVFSDLSFDSSLLTVPLVYRKRKYMYMQLRLLVHGHCTWSVKTFFLLEQLLSWKAPEKKKKQQKTYTGRILILFFYKHVNEDHHSNTWNVFCCWTSFSVVFPKSCVLYLGPAQVKPRLAC